MRRIVVRPELLHTKIETCIIQINTLEMATDLRLTGVGLSVHGLLCL